ncbi:hypothetical protein SAMN05443635_1031 [Roseobacter denitrificans OCh 114]|nr:hypothetical protein SAMN05443635_1031 [Roseobacter denitrificans OCh 114]
MNEGALGGRSKTKMYLLNTRVSFLLPLPFDIRLAPPTGKLLLTFISALSHFSRSIRTTS